MKFRCIIFISLCLYKSNIVTPFLPSIAILRLPPTLLPPSNHYHLLPNQHHFLIAFHHYTTPSCHLPLPLSTAVIFSSTATTICHLPIAYYSQSLTFDNPPLLIIALPPTTATIYHRHRLLLFFLTTY